MALLGSLCLLPYPGIGKPLPFAPVLRHTRGLGQCLHHRRVEATGSLHTARALGWGTVGDCLHSFPGTPLATHNAAKAWWHLTARFSMGLFLRVPGMAHGGKPKTALRTSGQGDAVPLGPEARNRPAFCPDSFLRVEHAPLT